MKLILLSAVYLQFFFGCTKQSNNEQAKQQNEALFRYKGKTYKKEDLPQDQQIKIFDAKKKYHNEIENIIGNYVVSQYVTEEAKKAKKDPKEIEKKLLEPKEPTEAEVKAQYEKKKARIPYPYEMVKGEIKKIMLQDRKYFAGSNLAAKAKEAGDFELLIEPVEVPKVQIDTTGKPSKGNPSAKITVIEFADFRCPHCLEAYESLKTLIPKYQDKIQFYYMYFPLPEEDSSLSHTLAKGAQCAFKQDKFWPYHDLAFENQVSLSVETPTQFAKQLNLDLAAFDKCMADPETLKTVVASKKAGADANVNGTPTFFVNGIRTTADDHLKTLEAEIKTHL